MSKTGEKLITISLRAPQHLSKWLDKKAVEDGRSKSNLAIRYLLEKKAQDPN